MLVRQAFCAKYIYIHEKRSTPPNVRLSGRKTSRKPFVKCFPGGAGGNEGRLSRRASGYEGMDEVISSDLIGKRCSIRS